ncbi:hypothetical protein [Orenia marismortui]|uniref:hypothetical protein n=1 Tax=Orenia marismortui TaxID=46469 RepID=UPI001064CF69|nr:hypothetical protein [Orenia marismortui]
MSKKQDIELCITISWVGFMLMLTGVIANLILKKQTLDVMRQFSFFYYCAPIGLFIISLCQIVLYIKYRQTFNWRRSLDNRPLDGELISGKKAFSTFLCFIFLFICSILALSLTPELWF